MRNDVTLEPKDPVAYPKNPARPEGARRPVYVAEEKAKQELKKAG